MHMGGDDYANICFEITQGTLPWQPILGTRSAQLAYPPVFLHWLHWYSNFRNRLEYRNASACIHSVDDLLHRLEITSKYTGPTFTKF